VGEGAHGRADLAGDAEELVDPVHTGVARQHGLPAAARHGAGGLGGIEQRAELSSIVRALMALT